MSQLLVLIGDDEYRLHQRLRHLRATHVDATLGELGYKRLQKPSVEALYEAALSVSFCFGSLPVLEVHQPSWFEKAITSKSEEARLQHLFDAWESVTASKQVVFVAPKMDKKLKFVKRLLQVDGVGVEEFSIPPPWKSGDVARLLRDECLKQGIRLEQGAALLLCEFLGHGLYPLMSECQRLHTFLGGKPISEAVVRQHVALEDSAFSIVDAWLQPQPLASHHWESLHQLLLTDAPLRLMGLLRSRLQYVSLLRSMATERLPLASMAKATGKKEYPIQKDLEQFAACSPQRLERLQTAWLEADVALKTGSLPPQLALELLFLN